MLGGVAARYWHDPAATESNHYQQPPLSSTAGPIEDIQPTMAKARTPTENVAGLATALRRRLYDDLDIRAAVEKVRLAGSADEKAWAANLVRECKGLTSAVVSEVTSESMRTKSTSALLSLQHRCSGVISLPYQDAKSLSFELSNSAISSGSVVMQLRQIQKNEASGDTRWTSVQANLIYSAMYSEEPALVREAMSVLLSAIDRKTPGGEERMEALLTVLSANVSEASLSEFETLQFCAFQLTCNDEPTTDTLTRPAATVSVKLLEEQFRKAIEQRWSPRDLLSIR